MVNNFARKPQSNDTGHIKAVAEGICKISIVNTYYIARLIAKQGEGDTNLLDQIGIVFPGENEHGTHVNISGAGLVKGAPNRQNGIKFLEYLTSKSAQEYFANGNNEYPVITNIAPSAAVIKLGSFSDDTINMRELGVNQAQAVMVFDKAGWP